MVEQDLKPVNSTTGTFVALRPQAQNDLQTGKTTPETGNILPVPERSSADMEELATELNVASQSIGRDLRFEVDMDSGRSVIQVLDRETGEVIRQIPPEEANLYSARNGAVQLRLLDALV